MLTIIIIIPFERILLDHCCTNQSILFMKSRPHSQDPEQYCNKEERAYNIISTGINVLP